MRVHLARAVGVAVAMLLSLAQPVAAANKAFVVGNARYAHTTSLPNPVNDAGDLAARLRDLGYQVTLGLDLGRTAFLRDFQTFVRSLAADDVALIYFAGHALQIGGENYLFPVDARVEKEADARQQLVALNALLADLSRSSRSRIVILDACRDNPFAEDIAKAQATRSAGTSRGLARVYAGVGSFIAYSTQPGNVALDGTGRNSPFTDALLKHMGTPGADVHAVMRRVRGDVQKATAEQQIPWENSSLVDEVSFAGSGSTALPSAAPKTAPVVASAPRAPAVAPTAESYHYVTGLDPKGDNFLALRTGTGADAIRIATMGPDTLLKVVESRGEWRKVVLPDGLTGWAHGKWIACCRTLAAMRPAAPAAAPAPPTVSGESCDVLWTRRNAIFHRYGYCFTGARGQQAFGNAGCSRDEKASRAAMSIAEREAVDALQARERAQGCR